MTFLGPAYLPRRELTGGAVVAAVAAMIGVALAGSTLVTPLYVIYKQEFGFSQITFPQWRQRDPDKTPGAP